MMMDVESKRVVTYLYVLHTERLRNSTQTSARQRIEPNASSI
jgi:hypothetical protein